MLTRRIIELLAPASCLSCGREGNVLCLQCADLAITGQRGICFRCNRPSAAGRTCPECRSATSLSGVTVACYYDGVIKELILNLKFARQRSAATAAADLIIPQLAGLSELTFDVVTSAPVAPSRYRERGYNQAELIAREVARSLRLPYRPLLGRWTANHQLGAGRQERLEQIQGTMYALHRVADQRVLIVDDVVTTGATLAECAAVLDHAGADTVWGAAIARH